MKVLKKDPDGGARDLPLNSGEMNMYRECAEKLVKRDGYEKAKADTIKHRNMNSWGTYGYLHHNMVLKMIEELHEAGEA